MALIGNGVRRMQNPGFGFGAVSIYSHSMTPAICPPSSYTAATGLFGKMVGVPYGARHPVASAWPRASGALASKAESIGALSAAGTGTLWRTTTGDASVSLTAQGAGVMWIQGQGAATLQVGGGTSPVVGLGWVGGAGGLTLDGNADVSGWLGTDGTAAIALDGSGTLAALVFVVGNAPLQVDGQGALKGIAWNTGSALLLVTGQGDGQVWLMGGGTGALSLTAAGTVSGVGHLVGGAPLELAGSLVPHAIGWMQGTTEEQGAELTLAAIEAALPAATWTYGGALDLLEVIGKLTGNNVEKDGDIVTIYETDGHTVWRRYNLANGGRVLVP